MILDPINKRRLSTKGSEYSEMSKSARATTAKPELRRKASADVGEFLASIQSDGRAGASPGPTMASTHYNVNDSVQKRSTIGEVSHGKAKRMEKLA